MRILYISCHEILEHDEVKLFHELGHYVFSPSSYFNPRNPDTMALRPGIDMEVDEADQVAWHVLGQAHPGLDIRNHLTKEFVDRFDVVIVMHLPQWITKNWDAMCHKLVIWRTIGQSNPEIERCLLPYRQQGLKIVRYSPKESGIPDYVGSDAVIRFYKDPNEFRGWEGHRSHVITLAQSMKSRSTACGYPIFEEATRKFSRYLFGPNNEDSGIEGGKLSYMEMKEALRVHRVYFYTGTHPASYTLNFVEAWMTGIPIVAIGRKMGNEHFIASAKNLYEIPDLINNGVNGFVSDSVEELQEYIQCLMDDVNLAQDISIAARTCAVVLFGKEATAKQWDSYLKTL